ncbi:MAG: hypothetical protein O2821_04695 [Chloroflexi bacterium]|nr:hypothetical protein [Chloroflexota bacterium]MDA1226371.1 hypothetical protein [Chloroflexota bacterium]
MRQKSEGRQGFWTTQSPTKRVASLDCHFPFSPALVKMVFPKQKIILGICARLE